jgi:ubiquinone/menaquinone biosynthesis C-methylase UbiE
MISKYKALKSSYKFWEIHNTAKGFPENYPDEEVVRFLMRLKSKAKILKKKIKDFKVLDLGSGSGKNVKPVIDIGFSLYCIDWSKGGINYIKNKHKNKKIDYKCLDFINNQLPYKNNYFDAVIATSIFDHIFKEDSQTLLKDAHRVLKENGVMISNLMTTKTNKKNRKGEKITDEKNTYLVKSGNSAGEIHSLFEKDNAKKFFSKYFQTKELVDYNILYNQKENLNVFYYHLKKI